MTRNTHIPASRNLFLSDLTLNLEGEVLADEVSLGIYATDASVYQIRPVAVALPKHEQDVSTALRIAADHNIAILPRGGGTSLAGQTVAEALVLDFSKYMNQVLEMNEAERWVRVQPGLVRDELNAYLAPFGLHFAPDPATSSRANVGGMAGNNSSGTKSILYGKTVDHILETRIALADGTVMHLKECSPAEYQAKTGQTDREGEIYREFRKTIEANRQEIADRFPKVMRRVGGYNFDEFIYTEDWNLGKLICGSEGTLAVILDLKLNLEPLPRFKSVAVVHFSEVLEAIRAVEPMLEYRPAAVEILDHTVLELSRRNLTTQHHAHFLEGDPAAVLIVEFYGDDRNDVLERPQQMIQRLKERNLGYAYPLFPDDNPTYDSVWVIRKKGLGLMLGMKGDKKPLPFIEDAGIPIQVLPEYIDKVLQICKKHQTEAAMYAHASVGVIHVRPVLDLRQAEDIERFKAIAEETFQLVKHYGGSWSGEHGDGLVRSPFNEKYFGPQLYEAFKQVKRLFDPEWRMNPGKIIESPPMDQNLRYGSRYRDEEMETLFHYREDGNFMNAVHMCTGVGECRKLSGGTMCPSFRATRDEEHSTRGRANALRLAMSGQLEEGLTSERVRQALDLCLSCKACKSECPSNVDMARLKSEVLQQHYDRNGAGLRDRLIRDSAMMARRLAGTFAPLINAVQGSLPFRLVQEKATGFDRRRTLPGYASGSFSSWYARNYTPVENSKGRVALFADTYLNYHEPSIGIAAVRLLNYLGFKVELAEAGCCQRPRISHGFLREARAGGTATAKNLDHYLKQNIPVLVCEPSCASALTDDLPDLIDDEALARRLQQGVAPIEHFIHRHLEGNDLPERSGSLLVHGHCHQKAIYGTQEMMAILRKSSGTAVKEIPSGCCGMAGSFGYEREHYELSKKVGEETLFPAVRKADQNTTVVACGFSCRHQIEHFTGRKAVHWVEAVMGE